MQNKKGKENILSVLLLIFFEIDICIAALFSSLFLFGTHFSYGNIGNILHDSEDSELIITTKVKPLSDEQYDLLYEDNTSKTPFVNCTSKFATASYDGNEFTVLDVPYSESSNKYYSYNHIYSDSAWPKLAGNTIVLSRELFDALRLETDSKLTLSFGEKEKEFTIIGVCDGVRGYERKRAGTIFAETFGYFAVVLKGDLDDVDVSGYLKTISRSQVSRDIEYETNKWFGQKGFDVSNSHFSNQQIDETYYFDRIIIQNKTLFVVSGIILLIPTSLLLFWFVAIYLKDILKTKLLRYLLPVIVGGVYFGGMFGFSKIVYALLGHKIIFKNTGALILPAVFGLICLIITILGALKNEKPVIDNKLESGEEKIMPTKTIWIMNHYATTPSNGPLPRHYYLAKRFMKAGYKVIIFASNQLHATGTEVEVKKGKYAEIDENGVKFLFLKTIRYHGNGVKRILNMISFYFALLRSWKSVVKKYGKPCVIIGSSAHLLTCVAALKIAKKNNIPCISEVRDLWPEELFTVGKVKEKSLFGKALLALEKDIYFKSDALVFTKEGDTDHIKEMKWDTKNGGIIDLKKCYYINNGVDFDDWNFNIENHKFELLDTEKRVFRVGYAGSIRPMNSVDFLIDTAEYLKNYSKIIFYIAGSGSLLEQLKQTAKEKGLKNVIFTGYLDKRKVPSFLSQMDLNILVYSNDHYNWSRGNSSNKLFEYMASGKPIISTVKMGYSIINKYNCGEELEEYTHKALATAIRKFNFMDRREYLKYCKRALEGSKDFDFDQLSLKYLNVIDKIIN